MAYANLMIIFMYGLLIFIWASPLLNPSGTNIGAIFFGVPFATALAGLPVAVGIGILKYHLYDIDLLINRTQVYITLSIVVIGIYLGTVLGIEVLLEVRGGLLVSLIGAGVIAVLFQPLRERLQRGVNRLLYGERDDPYRVLSKLGQRLEATIAMDAVLPSIAETVRDALKLPYVGVTLKENDRFRIAAETGTRVSETARLPLIYHSEPVGELLLATRRPGEVFSPLERRLLEDLARQAGVAVYAAQIAADLQRSRERLVMAREEERRRMRRDLHDGLGPQLASLTFKLETVRNRLADNPEVDALLAGLTLQVQAAIADIQRLV
jgi:signal transduction histidine kinase